MMKAMMRRMGLFAMVAVMALTAGCANKKKVAAKRGAAMEMTLAEQTGGEVTVTTTATAPATRPTEQIPVMVIQNDAVVQREWPEQVFWRANGDTIAGPTYWESIERAFRRSDEVNVFLEPVEFLANVALLPVRAVITPPWEKIQYSPVGPKTNETTATKVK